MAINSEPCLHRVLISGNLYAVGSNSRNVYICVSNSENEIKSQIDGDNSRPAEAKIIKTLSKHHKGSIYCLRYICVYLTLIVLNWAQTELEKNDSYLKIARGNGKTANIGCHQFWAVFRVTLTPGPRSNFY